MVVGNAKAIYSTNYGVEHKSDFQKTVKSDTSCVLFVMKKSNLITESVSRVH